MIDEFESKAAQEMLTICSASKYKNIYDEQNHL